MTITQAHFQKKIQSSEGEDLCLAQSIYADWLEERGDARADLLRGGIKVRSQTKADWTYEGDRLAEPSEQFTLLDTLRNGLTELAPEPEWLLDCRVPTVGQQAVQPFPWAGNQACHLFTYRWKDRPERRWRICSSLDGTVLPGQVYLKKEYTGNPIRFTVSTAIERSSLQTDDRPFRPRLWNEIVAEVVFRDAGTGPRERLIFDSAEECYLVAEENPVFEIYDRRFHWI